MGDIRKGLKQRILKLDLKPAKFLYIQSQKQYFHILFMNSPMDVQSAQAGNHQDSPQESRLSGNSSKKAQEEIEVPEIKIPRKPGRPPLRGKPITKEITKVPTSVIKKEEEGEVEKGRGRERSGGYRDDSNLEGFIRIVDYLKKIQFDEISLHNKMNPYNIMTPSCFWFTVSAEYFSFDFFSGRNTHDLALDFIKKAQKTPIILPFRVIKPQKVETELEFETQELKNLAQHVAEKLPSLVPLPLQTMPENIQKNTHLSSIPEDDLFRSSTRAIVFNYIKKKISTNEKWSSLLQDKLKAAKDISPKEMASRILRLEEQFKHEHLDVAPQLFYRQINKKKRSEPSKNSRPRKKKDKKKKKSKKVEEQIFNESESENNKGKMEEGEEGEEQQDGNDDGHDEHDGNQAEQMHDCREDQQEQMNGSENEALEKNSLRQLQQVQQEQNENENINQNENQVEERYKSNNQQNNALEDENELKDEEEGDIGMQDENQNKNDNQNQNENQNEVKDENLNEQEEKENHDGKMKQQQEEDDIFVFNKVYDQDDVLLDSILHLPIDYIISILQSSITPPQLPQIQRPFLPVPKSDPLELVYQVHPEEQKFLEYMKERQEKMYQHKTTHHEDIEQKERQVQVEDAKCQVCTDGDYTDDNLIVFCSMCNISLHQRCVGLTKVPSDNWVCEVCAAFGPAGINVPCPLCNVKGGALKRTSIHINNPLFKDTNLNFHEYAKKCPVMKQKQEYLDKKQGDEEPYYDYFTKSSYPNDQPICHYVWVHYVCAIWVPECYFEEKNATINIKGVETIDKKRFKERCLVCNEFKGGACVKCENEKCTKFYHPQCARKKKVYMEQLNLDRLRYLIFCEAHEPLKVKRKIDVKKKKQRDEIIKFCRGIQKYVETYKIATLNFKLSKVGTQSSMQVFKQDKKDKNSGVEKVSVKIQRNSDEQFIKSIIESLLKQNQLVVKITKLSEGRYKVDEVLKPSKRQMRKSLQRVDEFWKNFHNGETIENNLRRFNNIQRENLLLKQKIDRFINGNMDEQGRDIEKIKKMGRKKKQRQTVIDQVNSAFCICRRLYQGETDMFQCEVCCEWYHHQCIGFIGTEYDAQQLTFHCMKCLNNEPRDVQEKLLEKCSKFFSEDSVYLNVKPSTPELKSEDSPKQFVPPLESQIKESKEVIENVEQSQKKKVPPMFQKLQKEQKTFKINFSHPFIVEGPFPRQNKNNIIKNAVSVSFEPFSVNLENKNENNKQRRNMEMSMEEELPVDKNNQGQKDVDVDEKKNEEKVSLMVNEGQQKKEGKQEKQEDVKEGKQKQMTPVNTLAPNLTPSELIESGNNQTPFFKQLGDFPKENLENVQCPVLTFSKLQVQKLLKQQQQRQSQIRDDSEMKDEKDEGKDKDDEERNIDEQK